MAPQLKDVHRGSLNRGVSPDLKVVIKDFVADNAYPANGYTLNPSDFGMTSIVAVVPCPTPDGAHAAYDMTTGKLKFLVTGSALSGKFAESGASTVNGSVARLIVFGL